jgi:very-short-patch-repair endonuclease
MHPVDALLRCGGAARAGRLRELGVPRRTLRDACLRGDVVDLGGGAFAIPDADPRLAKAVELSGVLSHASAAQWHGFDLWNPVGLLHVTVPIGTTVTAAEVWVHRGRLKPADVHPLMPVTRPLRTLLDCARRMPFCDAVVVIDSALRRRAVHQGTLRAAAEAAGGPGSSRLRRAVRHADALSGSGMETVLRLLIDLLDVEVQTQVFIPGVGKVDILINGWLVIEADGFEFHSDREAYRRDRRRDNAVTERGYTRLRFSWEDLVFRRPEVLRQIAAVLAVGPPRHPRTQT